MSVWQYTRGAELPGITIDAYDSARQPIDFSTGWTFTVKVGEPGKTAVTSAGTVTGAATLPNLTVNWASGALDVLTIGTTYTLQITAHHTASNLDRIYTAQLRIVDAVL